MGEINNNSQINKAIEVLRGLKENITSDDRAKCVKELRVTSTTISLYLNGKGNDLSTAERLIVFFRKLISKREQLLSGS